MLAGLFKAPSKFSPLVNLPAARARANVVLDNLVDAGFMTEGQVYGARRNPATPIDRREEDAPNYYLDWAFDEMRKLVDTFPKSVNESFFVVRTALDPKSAALRRARGRNRPCANTATITAPARRRWSSPISTAACARWSAAAITARASSTARSTRCASPAPRSSPMSMRPRLANGFTPNSIVVDSPVCIGNWCPHNYSGGYSGSIDADAGDHQFGQHHSGQAFDCARRRQSKARPRQDHSDRAQFRHLDAAARHAVAADRRRRGQRARARRRLRDLSQSRQGGRAACGA